MYNVLISFIAASVLTLILICVVWLLCYKNTKDYSLNSVFECGFSSWSEKRSPFSLQFFLTALVFLIFDIELVLLFPFLTNFSGLFWGSVKILFIFVAILFLGLIYEWNLNALEWKK